MRKHGFRIRTIPCGDPFTREFLRRKTARMSSLRCKDSNNYCDADEVTMVKAMEGRRDL